MERNFLIDSIKLNEESLFNGKTFIEAIQYKMFENGIYWINQEITESEIKNKDFSRLIRDIKIYNNDYSIILIVKENSCSWTNLSYGLDTKYQYWKRYSPEEFLSL